MDVVMVRNGTREEKKALKNFQTKEQKSKVRTEKTEISQITQRGGGGGKRNQRMNTSRNTSNRIFL